MKAIFAKITQTWKLFAALTIVVLRNRELRRRLMFIVSLMAMGLAFLGMVVLDEFLTEHVPLFLAFWALCAAVVCLMLLLAIYDMARVRAEVTGDAIKRLGEVFREVEGGHPEQGKGSGEQEREKETKG
jgi:hypothetical protein